MKYKNFRTVARVCVILAWVASLSVFAFSLASGFMAGSSSILLGIILGVFGGFLTFLFLYAFAQFIYVLLDIERNTRATVKALYEEVEKEEEVGKVASKETEGDE